MEIDEKYFKPTEKQADKIEDVLASGESVLWRAKPNKKSYIGSAIIKGLPFVLIWFLFDLAFIVAISILMSKGKAPIVLLGFLIPFFIIHLFPVWAWIWQVIKAASEFKNIEYAATDRRIIVRSGIIGIDFKFLDYALIESVNVKVGLLDKIFKVGDIYVNASTNSAVLFDISSPYDIGAKLQKVVLDIKTDINYPNALRPDDNPGYNTNYSASPFDETNAGGGSDIDRI